MTADVHSREQRLRKQAKLQSLHGNLANLRKQEASYIEVSATIPELLVNQINELRHQIEQLENELVTLHDESIQTPARQFYREAFKAELANDLEKALKLYKNATRSDYPDAEAALRSVRYQIKTSKNKPPAVGQIWAPAIAQRTRSRLWLGLVAILILVLIVIAAVRGAFLLPSREAAAVEPTLTGTSTPTLPSVILIVPETATPPLTNTPTNIPTPVPPLSTPTEAEIPTSTPTLTPTLRAAPQILEPKDGMVWKDGAIVFEFKELDLAYDELYCLNTLKGYDKTLTENWSFPAVGNKSPSIPIEANVFRIAKLQGMECIVWSAAVGKGSCDNIVSENTEERIIGLPQPCKFE